MPKEVEYEEFHLNLCRLKLEKQKPFHAPSKVTANVQRKKRGKHRGAIRRTAPF
jgi:hypothetical protein